MVHEVALAAAPESPELRAAYAAETAAVELVRDLIERKAAAEAAVETLAAERKAQSSRLASGADVTGADVRRAGEAVADAEATMTLLRDAIPKAVREAYRASRARLTAEGEAVRIARRPFQETMAAAEAALEAARAAHDKATAEAKRLPEPAQAALDATLDAHGRDRSARLAIEEWQRREQANESRRLNGQPLVSWP